MNPMLEKLMSIKKGKRSLPKEEVEGKMSAMTRLGHKFLSQLPRLPL